MRNQRLLYIDSIKGLAILLMVMGHVIATQYPNPYFVLDNGPRDSKYILLTWSKNRMVYSTGNMGDNICVLCVVERFF